MSRLKSKKNDYGVLAVVALITVFLLVGIGGLFYYKLSNSRNRFRVLIENVVEYLEENTLKDKPKSLQGVLTLGVNGKSTDEDEQQLMEILNKIDLSFLYGVDYATKRMNFEMKSSYDKKELLNSSFYMESGNGYLYLDNLYDKNIKVPIEQYDSFFKLNLSSDYRTIYDSIEKVLIRSLKDDYFEKDYVTIDSKKVLKTTLVLNHKNYQEMKKTVFHDLVLDDSFLTSLSNVTDKKVSVLKKKLNKIASSEDDYKEMDIVLYTKNDKFLKLELVFGGEKITMQREERDKYSYSYDEHSQVVYDGVVQASRKKDSSVQSTFLINDRKKGVSVQLMMTSSYEVNKKIEKKNVSNSILYTDVTEEEKNQIYSKVLENEGMKNLIQEFSRLGNKINRVFD
ncbi:MAG: hypothetical protein SO108_01700 [Bacilli bacterium]|nr:hypothetical protein [Bacilli bacterium]